MEITPEQCARFSELACKTEMSQIEGLFFDDPDTGLQPQEMARELWGFGYLPVPTVDALLEAMENEMDRRERKTKSREPIGVN